MDNPSSFLAAFRQHLVTKGVAPGTIISLVGLLSAMNLTLDADISINDVLTRLADACTDNATLLTLIQQQAAELDALKRISMNLTKSLELKVVLDEVLREALILVQDSDSVQIFLSHGKKMVFSAALNSDGSRESGPVSICFESVNDQVSQTRESFIVEDIRTHSLFQNTGQECSGAIIGLPLNIGNRLAGIMDLARAQVGKFTHSEIRLLTLLADQASIAIINARLHQAVSQQARYDVLTGLPNRLALEERLFEQIKSSNQKTNIFSVVMLDLDGFKGVNDTLGHNSGDEVLHRVAHFLQENLRAKDFIARYGGDEFTLVLPETDLRHAKLVVEKIRRRLANLAIQIQGEETFTLAISAGIAIYPEHAGTSPGLLRGEDEALYHAKRNTPGGFQVAVKPDA